MFAPKTLLALSLSALIAGPAAFADAYPNCADIQVNQLVDEETAKFAALQPFDEYVQFNCLDKDHVLRTNGINFYQVHDTLAHEVYFGYPTDAQRPPAKQIVPVAVTHHFWQGRTGAALAVTATVLGVIAVRRYLRAHPAKTAVGEAVDTTSVIAEEPQMVSSPTFSAPGATVSAEAIGYKTATGDIPRSQLILARSTVPNHIPTYENVATGERFVVQLNPAPLDALGHNSNLEAVLISDNLQAGQTASGGYWMSHTWTPAVYAQRAPSSAFGFKGPEATLEPTPEEPAQSLGETYHAPDDL